MKPWIMFTKHLEGWALPQIMDGLQRAGVEGADLCVRPGYPVTPENVLATVLHVLFDVSALRVRVDLPRELGTIIERSEPIRGLI